MMQIIEKSVSELIPYERNPRKNDKAVARVARSIKDFGFRVPIVIDRNNVVVAGHTRLKACKKLGISTVPCIIADDMTEEQVKAFRLADNRVAEAADWDYDILKEELGDIFSFDMTSLGFDFTDHETRRADTAFRVRNILNLERMEYPGVGKYDIPRIYPVKADEIPPITEWTGFNYVTSDTRPEGKAVHFFIDDYQFERIWNNPEKYIERLSRYSAVLSPDFSPYGDMPLATQIYNHYRKHAVGRYLQERGIKVIPTIRRSTDPRSLDWYLDGEPEGGVVCISNMWTSDKKGREYFLNKEYKLMKERLHPEKIYVYGKPMAELEGDPVEYIPTFSAKRWGGR